MRKESLIGLGFIAISLVLPRILGGLSQIIKYDGDLNKLWFTNFFLGAMTGLGLCFLVIGLLPAGAYDTVKNIVKNIFVWLIG